MKTLFTIFLLFVSSTLLSQDAKEILRKSYDTCKSIKQGYYEFQSDKKWFSGPKVQVTNYRTYFKQVKDDPIYSFYFHNEKDYFDTLRSIEVFNGDTQIRVFTYANSGDIMTKEKDKKDIINFKHNLTFLRPIIQKGNHPLNLFLYDYHIKYIKTDTLNNHTCFLININEKKSDHIKYEINVWIDTLSYLPVQYTEEFVSLIGKDTQTQFEKITLQKLETDIIIHDSIFSIKSIPDSFVLKNYEKYITPELLNNNSIFPDFKYVNLNDDSVQLSSLKGKVVLIDFFYKNCYPCVLAMPHIQALHEKYGDKGLVVLGIDPFDKKDVIAPFLETQGVTYEVLLGNGKEIRDKYHVSGYPCIYILNKKGEVVLAKTGYGKGMEKKYNKAIRKALKE